MRKIRLFIFFSLIFSFICLFQNGYSQDAKKIGKLFEKLSWRCVGPAVMGGRTVDIEAVEKKPWIIYAAIGPSGVWKSENNGITWKPVFHKQKTVSVGDIAISQSHPNIIWVGTGEATCQNSVTIGDGLYKSTDGGKTWKNMGLEETRHISRIIINPGDPNIIYVFSGGLYVSKDKGKKFKAISAGIHPDHHALWIDPSNALHLIDGNDGGIDISYDLGNNW